MEEQLKILKLLIKKKHNEYDIDLEEIKSLLKDDFLNLYFEIVNELDRFFNIFIRNDFLNKSMVSLAGSFSSGKSSFINTLLGNKVLPTGINPATTSVTYLAKADSNSACATNIFNSDIKLKSEYIKIISHGFDDAISGDTYTEDAQIGHLLKNIVIKTPMSPYENIVFLDTPGFGASDDFDNTIYHVRSSDLLIWFVSAEMGTITEKDLFFLKSIPKELPKLFIINKCDKVTDIDVKLIKTELKNTLNGQQILFENILTFSSRIPEKYNYKKIREILARYNTIKDYSDPYSSFRDLFDKAKEKYSKELVKESRRLFKLNRALMLSDLGEELTSLAEEIKEEINFLKSKREEISVSENSFYTDLSNNAKRFGVTLPKPNEILLHKRTTWKYLKVLLEYKESNNIENNFDVYKVIKDFSKENIKPNIAESIFESFKQYNEIYRKTVNLDFILFGNINYNESFIDIIKKNL